MEYKLYCNNVPFTSKNITTGLDTFWVRKVLAHKNKKIWLTIDLNFTDNSTLKLIQNLPFNCSDYCDLLTVAEGKLRSNLLYSKADLLDSIAFTYHIEKRKVETLNKYGYIFAFIFFVLFSAIFFTLCSSALAYTPACTIEIPEEVLVKNKLSKTQFNLIIDLFKVDNYHLYSPSYFLPSNLVVDIIDNKEPAGSFIVELIRNKQYETLNYITQITLEHINTMQTLTKEYSDIVANTIK